MNQKLFVFGGSSPIAMGCSTFFRNQGAEIVHFTRKPEQECFAPLKNLGIEVATLDLASLTENVDSRRKIEELIMKWEPGGILFGHRSKETNLEKSFHTDVIAPSTIIELFASLAKNKEKSVVFLTSPAGSFIQKTQELSYHLSKSAQSHLARYYAVNYGQFKVRVNCIAPGAFVEKERSRKYYSSNSGLFESILSEIPLGRFAKNEDIASLAYFLLTENSCYLNGQEIYLDGGLSKIDQSQYLV